MERVYIVNMNGESYVWEMHWLQAMNLFGDGYSSSGIIV